MYLPESPQMPREEQAKAFPHKPYSRHTMIMLWTIAIISTAGLSCEFIIEVANT